jgi:HD-GYP domain-containing protein (c-di-GMP phosphodiesterase class II)
MDLDDDEVQVIGLAALVHDIGKVGVHDEVLLKQTPLTADERHEMELHTLLGERILAPTRIDEVLPIVRSHHERWDGRGYPDGLSGEQIPLGARILAVCDAFDALFSGRSYRPRMSLDDSLGNLLAGAGTRFDPEIVEKFAWLARSLDAARATQPLPLTRPEPNNAL